jgi:hypothetical protein
MVGLTGDVRVWVKAEIAIVGSAKAPAGTHLSSSFTSCGNAPVAVG